MHWFVSHLIYLSLTKNIIQQYFHPSAKLLLYRQAHSQGVHSGAVLPDYILPRKTCLKHIVKTKILSPYKCISSQTQYLITPSFAGRSFRVNQVKLVHFYQFTVVRFYFCLKSQIYFRVVMQVELVELSF